MDTVVMQTASCKEHHVKGIMRRAVSHGDTTTIQDWVVSHKPAAVLDVMCSTQQSVLIPHDTCYRRGVRYRRMQQGLSSSNRLPCGALLCYSHQPDHGVSRGKSPTGMVAHVQYVRNLVQLVCGDLCMAAML